MEGIENTGNNTGNQGAQGATQGANGGAPATPATINPEVANQLEALSGLVPASHEVFKIGTTQNPAQGDGGANGGNTGDQGVAAAGTGNGTQGGDGANPNTGTGTASPEAGAGTQNPEGGDGSQQGQQNGEGDNPFLKKVEKGTPAVITEFSHLSTQLKNEFGMEVKEIKDMPTFLKAAQGWRKEAQAKGEIEKKVTNYQTIFEKMPPRMYDGVMAWINGQDWEKVIANQPKFDFSQEVDKVDKNQLINTYFPGKFTEEDFKAEPGTPEHKAVSIAEVAAKEAYNKDKADFEDQRTKLLNVGKEKQKLITTSAKRSVEALDNSFPDLSDGVKNEVLNTLTGAGGGINGLFYNADGSLKEDAARNIVLLKYGYQAIEQLRQQAATAATTAANEEILTRGADQPHVKSGGAGTGQASPAFEQSMKQLNELKQAQKTTF